MKMRLLFCCDFGPVRVRDASRTRTRRVPYANETRPVRVRDARTLCDTVYDTPYSVMLSRLQHNILESSTHSSFKELLVEPPTFPLLLASSAYLTSPVFARWCECRWIVGCHGGRLRWRIESLDHFHTPHWRRSIIILVSTSWTSPPYVSTT